MPQLGPELGQCPAVRCQQTPHAQLFTGRIAAGSSEGYSGSVTPSLCSFCFRSPSVPVTVPSNVDGTVNSGSGEIRPARSVERRHSHSCALEDCNATWGAYVIWELDPPLEALVLAVRTVEGHSCRLLTVREDQLSAELALPRRGWLGATGELWGCRGPSHPTRTRGLAR